MGREKKRGSPQHVYIFFSQTSKFEKFGRSARFFYGTRDFGSSQIPKESEGTAVPPISMEGKIEDRSEKSMLFSERSRISQILRRRIKEFSLIPKE